MAPAPRRRKRAEPIASGPLDIALEAVANDTSLDSPARTLLVNQNRLITAQLLGERLSNALKVGTGLVGLAAAIALGVLVWQAKHAGGLVVEPFSVPPDLAARGLTGQAVASQLLDRIALMQAQTATSRIASSYSNDWGNDVKVAIPATGVSLGELQSALRQWLGHETRVSGEVFHGPQGLSVAARATGAPAAALATGPDTALSDLMDQVARDIFKSAQPDRYARWLFARDDLPAAQAILEQTTTLSQDPVERAWALQLWGLIILRSGDHETALEKEREALRLNPKFSMGWTITRAALTFLGRHEAALAASDQALKLYPNDPQLSPIARRGRDEPAANAILRGNHAGGLKSLLEIERNPRQATEIIGSLRPQIATELAYLHETTAAGRAFAVRSDQRIGVTPARERTARMVIALINEDWPALLALQPEIESAAYIGPTPRVRAASVEMQLLALAKAMTGDHAGAANLVAESPLNCDRCVTMRGRLAALAGDIPTSEHWFSEGARIAPSLPQPLYDWGQARLARGDLAGAATLFVQAQKKGPGWAEPLKGEADVLSRQGKYAQAVSRYAAADQLAPRWGGLHLSWGEALAKLGKTAEARAQWTIADGLDLTPAERARLDQLGVR